MLIGLNFNSFNVFLNRPTGQEDTWTDVSCFKTIQKLSTNCVWNEMYINFP